VVLLTDFGDSEYVGVITKIPIPADASRTLEISAKNASAADKLDVQPGQNISILPASAVKNLRRANRLC
jgi:S-adenosylmethionine hydrolase